MELEDIVKKINEEQDVFIAKRFTEEIAGLLRDNNILPIILYQYDEPEIDIKDYFYKVKYGIAFELDCSERDNEVYNRAIDDFANEIKKAMDNRYLHDIYPKDIDNIAELLKKGGKDNVNE